MRRTMIFTSLALVAVTQALADAQKSESDWQQTVNSDKETLSRAISDMEEVAQDYRRASQNRTRAMAFSLNLAEKSLNDAHKDSQHDHSKAMTDFNHALKNLTSASATGDLRDAEKAARQKSTQVDKVERQEAEDAKLRLRTQREHESNKVSHTFNQAKTAANKLLRDRSHLERAMRRNGKSEREYESVSQQLEHHAESQRDYAENNKDQAADAVEHIFERAQDHVEDREQQLHDRSADARQKAVKSAVEEALASMRRQQAAESSPVASAINLLEKAKSGQVHETKEQEQQKRKEQEQQKRKDQEQDAQHTLNADKARLSTAMDHLGKVATGLQMNKTDGEALAAKIAKDVFDNAAESKKDEKKKAMGDFKKYLSNLKSASATGSWRKELSTVQEQARYLDKLDDEENEDARKGLHRKHASQKSEVKKSARDAHQSAMKMLRDKDHLERAMRRAGAKEREYEGEEENNEEFAERHADKAEDLNDHADDAVQRIYERAGENLHKLQHANRKEQQSASHERHQAIYDAVETLKFAREGKTSEEKVYRKKEATRGDNTANENDGALEKIQQQMESLQKGLPFSGNPKEAEEELLATPSDFSSFYLALGSFGLLIFFYTRQTRRAPVTPPLLG